MNRVTVVVTLGGADWQTSDRQLRQLARGMVGAALNESVGQDHEIVAIQSKIARKVKVVKAP